MQTARAEHSNEGSIPCIEFLRSTGSNLAFHVDFCSQIHRVRIFCGGQPGQEERKLKCVTLGKFRTLTLAEQAARVYMQVNGVNDRHAQEQSIMSLTFGQQADKFLTASIDPARRGGLSHGQPTTFGGEQSILG